MDFIKIIGPDCFLVRADLLGTEKAWLWIGNDPEGPTDDDSERVRREREEISRHPVIGADGKQRPAGIEAMEVSRNKEYPDWYEINTSNWSAGVYRCNLHGVANEATPSGTLLNPDVRDLEYSWLTVPNPEILSLDQRKFVYQERNGRGFCIRINITAQRDITPAV